MGLTLKKDSLCQQHPLLGPLSACKSVPPCPWLVHPSSMLDPRAAAHPRAGARNCQHCRNTLSSHTGTGTGQGVLHKQTHARTHT